MKSILSSLLPGLVLLLYSATTPPPFVVADKVRYLGLDISSQPQEDVFHAWRAANPDHTLETSYVTIPEVPSAVQRDLSVDKAFDVLQTYMPLPEYAAGDLVADVTEAVKDPQFQWTDIPAAARDWLTTYQDRVYGIPVDADPLVLYYRRDLIDKAPTTWEELIETAQKFHGQDLNGDGIPDYGTCMITEGQFAMYAWLIANTVFRYKTSKLDGYVFDVPTDGYTALQSLLRTEGYEYVLEVLSEMYKVSQGWGLASGFGPENAYATFKTGRCATMISFPSAGSWSAEAPNGTFMRTRMGTVRTPGSTRVFDRTTNKLVRCNPDLCRFQEYGSVNRPTFMAGGVILIIRKDTPVFEAALNFAAYFSVHADTRKPGALNPYRGHHFNASRFPAMGWNAEDARQYTEALYDTMSSDRTASVPRVPGAAIMNAEMERGMKEAIRFGMFANYTTTYSDILARVDASITSGLADQGLTTDAFDELWRIDIAAPPRKFHQKRGFPAWLILLIAVAVLTAVGVAAFFLRRYLQNAAAPKNPEEPITVLFVTAKNAAVLSEEFPAAFENMVKEYEALVRASVSASGCYQVKRIGEAFMIVARSAQKATDCIAEIRSRYEKASWWRVDPNQQILKRNLRKRKGGRVTEEGDTESLSSARNSSNGSHSVRSAASSRSARSQGTSAAVNRSTFEISCGVQIGQLRIVYDADANHYDYQGLAVSEAATCADVAVGGQDVATEEVEVSLPESYSRAKLREFTIKKIGKKEIQLYQINTEGRKRQFKVSQSSHNDGGADSVLAALDTASGSLGRRNVSALLLSIPSLPQQGNGDKDLLSEAYRELMSALAEILEDTKGHLQSAVGGDFVITFNAHHPASSHVRKAVLTYHEFKSVCDDASLPLTASLVSGSAFVGTNSESHCSHSVCLSSMLHKGRALLGIAASQAKTCDVQFLADNTMSEELETCCRILPTDIVELPNTGNSLGGKPAVIFGITDLLENKEDEWMYVLEKDETSANLDSAFKALALGNIHAANDSFQHVKETAKKKSATTNSGSPMTAETTTPASAPEGRFAAAFSKLEALIAVGETGALPVTAQGPFYDSMYLSK